MFHDKTIMKEKVKKNKKQTQNEKTAEIEMDIYGIIHIKKAVISVRKK